MAVDILKVAFTWSISFDIFGNERSNKNGGINKEH